jgi:hypothetical protein
MPTETNPPVEAPQADHEAHRRDSLDQQVKFAGQRVLQMEQQVLIIERELVDLDRKIEETRGTPGHDASVKERETKAQTRLNILESIAVEKQSGDILKAKLGFVS